MSDIQVPQGAHDASNGVPLSIMKPGRYLTAFVIIWFAERATSISTEYSSISTLLQSRLKRDDDYHVKCHQSGTGKTQGVIIVIILANQVCFRVVFIFRCAHFAR